MQADRVGESPVAGCCGQTLVVSLEGGEGAVREKQSAQNSRAFCVCLFFLPVIYKTQLTLVTFQAAAGAGRAPSPMCVLFVSVRSSVRASW